MTTLEQGVFPLPLWWQQLISLTSGVSILPGHSVSLKQPGNQPAENSIKIYIVTANNCCSLLMPVTTPIFSWRNLIPGNHTFEGYVSFSWGIMKSDSAHNFISKLFPFLTKSKNVVRVEIIPATKAVALKEKYAVSLNEEAFMRLVLSVRNTFTTQDNTEELIRGNGITYFFNAVANISITTPADCRPAHGMEFMQLTVTKTWFNIEQAEALLESLKSNYVKPRIKAAIETNKLQ